MIALISYHSPYPEIKLSNEMEAISARRAPVADDAGSGGRSKSAMKSLAGSRHQSKSASERHPGRNGIAGGTSSRKSTHTGAGVDGGSVRRMVEDDIEMQEATTVLPSLERPNGSVTARESSRHVNPRIARPSGSRSAETHDMGSNGTLDQYGLEHSPVQVSRNQRSGLDEQEYDPDQPRPSSKSGKSTGPQQTAPSSSRRSADDEPVRQRRPVKRPQDLPSEVVKPRSLWVCDRCFKYMPMESAYVSHIVRTLRGL